MDFTIPSDCPSDRARGLSKGLRTAVDKVITKQKIVRVMSQLRSGRDSVSPELYAMHVMPVLDFLKLDVLMPHEACVAQGTVVPVPMGGRVLFASVSRGSRIDVPAWTCCGGASLFGRRWRRGVKVGCEGGASGVSGASRAERRVPTKEWRANEGSEGACSPLFCSPSRGKQRGRLFGERVVCHSCP